MVMNGLKVLPSHLYQPDGSYNISWYKWYIPNWWILEFFLASNSQSRENKYNDLHKYTIFTVFSDI